MRLGNLNIGDIGLRHQAKGRAALTRPVYRVVATLACWRERAGQRAELARLGRPLWKDLGITDADVWRETRKWFWQP